MKSDCSSDAESSAGYEYGLLCGKLKSCESSAQLHGCSVGLQRSLSSNFVSVSENLLRNFSHLLQRDVHGMNVLYASSCNFLTCVDVYFPLYAKSTEW